MLGAVFARGRLFACSLPTGVLGKLRELALTSMKLGQGRQLRR